MTRQKKYEKVEFRSDPSIKELIKAAAASERRSESDMAREAVLRYFEGVVSPLAFSNLDVWLQEMVLILKSFKVENRSSIEMIIRQCLVIQDLVETGTGTEKGDETDISSGGTKVRPPSPQSQENSLRRRRKE